MKIEVGSEVKLSKPGQDGRETTVVGVVTDLGNNYIITGVVDWVQLEDIEDQTFDFRYGWNCTVLSPPKIEFEPGIYVMSGYASEPYRARVYRRTEDGKWQENGQPLDLTMLERIETGDLVLSKLVAES